MKALFIFVSLWIVTGLLIIAGLIAYFDLQNTESSLPRPTQVLNPSPDNLDALTDRASKYEQETVLTRYMTVRWNDWKYFKVHMRNIAASKGWYIHSWPYGDNFKLVLPASDFMELLHLEKDATGWVRRNISTNMESRGPSNLELIHVQIDGDILSRKHDLLTVGYVFCWIFAGILLLSLIVFSCCWIFEWFDEREKKRKKERKEQEHKDSEEDKMY